MTSPVPGLASPSPRTWVKGDQITTPRLRGDMTNLAALFTTGRPLIAGDAVTPVLTGGTSNPIGFALTWVNNWNVTVVNSTSTGVTYAVPFAGWYLAQMNGAVQGQSGGNDAKYAVGFKTVQNGAGAVSYDGGASAAGTGAAPGDVIGMYGADLYQFNPETTDTIVWYVYTGLTTGLVSATMMAEWIALPTSGLTDYTGSYGTVVPSPQPLAAFPPGPGTYVTSPVSAGATSIAVNANTGMVTGGTLGLDYVSGQLYQPVAEAVTITSVTGTTIGISAAAYPHLVNAPVAVPVSAAFLNQQCRDVVNFLSYPPMLRTITNQAQSIASSGFPPTVGGNPANQITTFGTVTLDNFSGFASSAYTVPVAGVYYVYGQVYLAGSTSAFSMAAGISVSGGTIQWGTTMRADSTTGAQSFCPTVVRHLRLTAGQTITLWTYQGSGSAMNTVAAGSDVSRLICIWRGA